MKLVLVVGLILVMFAVAPLITMWSLNTLFGVGFAYTFKNWLAWTWLTLVAGGLFERAAGRKS